MNVWGATVKIIRHWPRQYALSLLSWTTIRFLPLLPGLITRQVFDVLTGSAPAGTNLPTCWHCSWGSPWPGWPC